MPILPSPCGRPWGNQSQAVCPKVDTAQEKSSILIEIFRLCTRHCNLHFYLHFPWNMSSFQCFVQRMWHFRDIGKFANRV